VVELLDDLRITLHGAILQEDGRLVTK